MTEIRALSSNVIIFKTINIFLKFYCIFEIYIKFCLFWKKITSISSICPKLFIQEYVFTWLPTPFILEQPLEINL